MARACWALAACSLSLLAAVHAVVEGEGGGALPLLPGIAAPAWRVDPVDCSRPLRFIPPPHMHPPPPPGSGVGGVPGPAVTAQAPGPHLAELRVALFSFPGSGNTWLRHLVHRMTGLHTGSLYKDSSLVAMGMAGEGRARGVIMIKHHYGILMGHNPAAVVLYRDPVEAIASEWNRHYAVHMLHNRAESHVLRAPPESFQSPEFRQWALEGSQTWARVHGQVCLNASETVDGVGPFKRLSRPCAALPVLFMRYGHLRQNPRAELVRLVAFLRHLYTPLLSAHRPDLLEWDLSCALADLMGAARRESGPLSAEARVGPELVAHIRNVTATAWARLEAATRLQKQLERR